MNKVDTDQLQAWEEFPASANHRLQSNSAHSRDVESVLDS